VFFSNLGPGSSFQSDGWCVSGPASSCGSRFDEAMSFVPSVNGRVTRIDIGLTNFSGPNSATVLLAQDNGGVPGHVLGQWAVSGQPPFGSTTCCPTTIILPATVPIGAGRTYWVIARAGTTTTNDGWNWNYYGTVGTYAYSTNGSNWSTSYDTISAFAVIGCTGACHT
jgi:hypothetical protein